MTLTYFLTPESLATALSSSYAYRRPLRRILMPVCGSIFVIASLWFLINDDSSKWVLGLSLLAVGGIYLFLPVFQRRKAIANAFSGRTDELSIEMTTSEEGIAMKSPGTTGMAAWSSFVDVHICNKGVLLYPQKSLFYWVPETAVVEGGTWQDFTDLIASKITRKI